MTALRWRVDAGFESRWKGVLAEQVTVLNWRGEAVGCHAYHGRHAPIPYIWLFVVAGI